MRFASVLLFSRFHKAMDVSCGEPLALFLSPDGNIYPDTLICNGLVPSELDGKPCPYSQAGRFTQSVPLNPLDPTYTQDKGQPGNLCPTCVLQQLGNLGHWQGDNKQTYPEELLPLRLFKCRTWFWLVVLGLYDADPTKLSPSH